MSPIGIPIGNLTSQIFANIYLNELDRMVKYVIKPLGYLRYGDDFIIIANTRADIENMRSRIITFLIQTLGLEINRKYDIIVPVKRGLHFLGTHIFPAGRCLNSRNWQRAIFKLNTLNLASYRGLVAKHNAKKLKYFDWIISQYYDNI